MGKFQIFVLLSVVTCAIITTVQSVPVKDSSIESENAAKCKKLCGFCGCTGYYCGDECLCECNSQNDGEAECVDTMKSNCKKLELPFEVLIQGPNVNRMVRSLLYADPDEEICVQSSETNQKKRSTISIYKPDAREQQDEVLSAPTVDKAEVHEVPQEDSPIHIIVAQKLDSSPVKIQQIDHSVPKENAEQDDVDRINIKRHIIDVNQDIDEFNSDSDDDSFLFKRGTDTETKEDPKPEGESDKVEVQDDTVASVAPPAPPVPTPLLPRVQEAIKKMTTQIPTSAEIKTAWEGVRKELNSKINVAIADAKKRATELRARITPPVTPAQPIPAKLNPFLKAENEEGEVAMPLAPVIPVAFATLPIRAEIAKTTLPIQAEIAKGIAAFRANHKIMQETARWLVVPPLFVGAETPAEEVAEVKPAEEKPAEEKSEP